MPEYIDRIKVIEIIKEKEREGLSFKSNDLDGIPFFEDVVKGSDFRDCRNELCMKCGRYREKHLGACDGCRWE